VPVAFSFRLIRISAVVAVAAFVAGCSKQAEQPAAQKGAPAEKAAAAPASAKPAEPESELPPPSWEAALPEDLRAKVSVAFTGDLDEAAMRERRVIRAGVTYNRSFYFVDKGVQRGLSYEYLTLFEEHLNKALKTGNLKIHVVPLAMPRDMLIPALQAGRIDLIAAQLTITPERQQLVDFTDPTRRHVNEIVVTGPAGPALSSVDDLSGKTVFARKTSSYYSSLQTLNRRFAVEKKRPVDIQEASESLEDDDLLEMVNAGLIPAVVVDDYLADFWKKVFTKLTVHDAIKLRLDGTLAVAIRKNSPKLAAALNGFVAKFGLDSALGRTLNKRYLESTKFVKNAASDEERRKFLAMVDLFRKYGEKYKIDYLLMAAQGYQESRLDQGAKSQVGAVGVMQLMPETGKEQNVGDIHQLEPNIHAGVKYMRFVRNEFFEDQPMDDLNKALFTFASYNAGPGRVRQLRRETEKRGLNPNVWFGNVEQIASERIGRETVTYVSNIYKYYVAYRLVVASAAQRKAAKSATGKGG